MRKAMLIMKLVINLLGQESELELHPASPTLTQLGVCPM